MKQKEKGKKKMNDLKLDLFWEEIPIGKENAVDYDYLKSAWVKSERAVRKILHDLSSYDNGDNFVLIRSASGKGFYRTDDDETILAYKQECLNKGKSVFAPVKKINRILKSNTEQFTVDNNLRVVRESLNLKQSDVCSFIKKHDNYFDTSMLSKFENGVCLPTPLQLSLLARFYGCTTSELVDIQFYE